MQGGGAAGLLHSGSPALPGAADTSRRCLLLPTPYTEGCRQPRTAESGTTAGPPRPGQSSGWGRRSSAPRTSTYPGSPGQAPLRGHGYRAEMTLRPPGKEQRTRLASVARTSPLPRGHADTQTHGHGDRRGFAEPAGTYNRITPAGRRTADRFGRKPKLRAVSVSRSNALVPDERFQPSLLQTSRKLGGAGEGADGGPEVPAMSPG